MILASRNSTTIIGFLSITSTKQTISLSAIPTTPGLNPCLDDFIAHLERHFAREEAIFEKCREQGMAKVMATLLEKALRAFENIRDQIAGGDRDVDARAIVEYLHRWLIDHVIVQNFNMKPDLVGDRPFQESRY